MEIQMKKQQGFTLIELMIVVAIIGILAAIAIPAYQDYIVRSKVTELVTAADACKTSVSEYAQSQNTLPADTTVAGCTNSPTKFISDLTVVDGVITVAATASIGGTITAGQGLSLTPKFRSEEHTSELQSLMRSSYDVFCLKKQNTETN